jgi:hypothetical protein
MEGNSLHGTIPTTLGMLHRLQRIFLSRNRLSGSLPESVLGLLQLERLFMSDNELTGSVPRLSTATLEKLILSSNFFSGTISDSDSFENLRLINLDLNMLTGSIPESIYSTKLDSLSLWDNQISGSLSDKVGRCVELKILDLSENDLTGTIPSAIGALSNLEALYLYQNAITGTIPSEMGLLTRLSDLLLENNRLSGTVPFEFSSLSPSYITLYSNNITGSLDILCNQTAIFTSVEADCGGVDPQVECSCCVSCCDSSTCVVNNTNTCFAEKSRYDRPKGHEYVESAGTVCECISSDIDAAYFSCMDTQCQSCNLDGTVCSINMQYQRSIQYDEDSPYDLKFQATYQYVVGRNDTVTLETTLLLSDVSLTCEVAVNGQFCNSCFLTKCADEFWGFNVECTNVEGAGYIDLCDEKRSDDDGPLAVFAFQDPVFSQGCPPRIWPSDI